MSDGDREKAMVLFGPYPVKRAEWEAFIASTPIESEEFRRLYSVWEVIDAERHADFPDTLCDDRLCDKCGSYAMGDDW